MTSKNPFSSAGNLKKILKRLDEKDVDEAVIAEVMSELQPLITAANIGKYENLTTGITI